MIFWDVVGERWRLRGERERERGRWRDRRGGGRRELRKEERGKSGGRFGREKGGWKGGRNRGKEGRKRSSKQEKPRASPTNVNPSFNGNASKQSINPSPEKIHFPFPFHSHFHSRASTSENVPLPRQCPISSVQGLVAPTCSPPMLHLCRQVFRESWLARYSHVGGVSFLPLSCPVPSKRASARSTLVVEISGQQSSVRERGSIESTSIREGRRKSFAIPPSKA